MMEVCKLDSCTGCSACANICPKAAIHMRSNEKGFLYPEVDAQVCISCGKCIRICPQNKEPSLYAVGAVYAARSLQDGIRRDSSSGGIFSALAEQTIAAGGVVFGAAYGENLEVEHIGVACSDDLWKLRGSKYVQSSIGNAYQQAGQLLNVGTPVLFSGTPCQIAGLKAFLGREDPLLLTVDILCHGVPSPLVFRKYADCLERELGAKLEDYRFRSKPFGWKRFKSQIRTKDGACGIIAGDPYMDGFLRNIYLRDSCYRCPYAAEKRIGDITLGDYWGYEERFPDYLLDDDKGMSLVTVNTEKGKAALRKIRRTFVCTKRSMEDAKRGNRVLSGPFAPNECTKEFWELFDRMSWQELCERFSFPSLELLECPDSVGASGERPYWLRQLRHTLGGSCRAVRNKFRRK